MGHDILDYLDQRLAAGYAASTLNTELRSLHAFLLYLQEQAVRLPLALLRLPFLKEPDRLPRFLTDEQVRRVRDDIEPRVTEARFAAQAMSSAPPRWPAGRRRDAVLDRAAFYLTLAPTAWAQCGVWHGGLRLGEVEELRLEDLDLPNRKVMVRQGKGQQVRRVRDDIEPCATIWRSAVRVPIRTSCCIVTCR